MVSRIDDAVLGARAARFDRAATGRASHLSRGVRLLFVVSLVTFALASTFSAVALFSRVSPALFPGQSPLGKINFIEKAPFPIQVAPDPASPFNRRINLLVIGLDKRPDNRDIDPYNSDTLMIATVDPVTKQAAILSLPRDLLIDIRLPSGGLYEGRVNESYGIGVNSGKTFEAGAEQLQKDIKANFGIDTDYWVVMDFKGVEKLVNAIGGVDLDIPAELAVPDWWYSDDDLGAVLLAFPPGRVHLDGYRAVAFGRYREDDNDLERIKRQQLVVMAAIARVFSRGLLSNPFELYDAYSKTVQTNVPRAKMPGLGLLLKQTSGKMKTYSLGDPVNGSPTVLDHVTRGGAIVLKWNRDNVQQIIAQVFVKSSYVDSHVEIQNGFGRNGGANAAALGRYLRFQGIPAVSVGGDVTTQPRTEIVLYAQERREMAEDIAEWLGIAESAIRTESRADLAQPDVIITLGEDFKIPG